MVAMVSVTDVVMAIKSVGSIADKLSCSPVHSSLVDINSKFLIGIPIGTPRTLVVQTRNSRAEPIESGHVKVRGG